MKIKQMNNIAIFKEGKQYILRVAKTKEYIKTVATFQEAEDFAYLNHTYLDHKPLFKKRMAMLDVNYELNTQPENICL